jgi:hypothetical protein
MHTTMRFKLHCWRVPHSRKSCVVGAIPSTYCTVTQRQRSHDTRQTSAHTYIYIHVRVHKDYWLGDTHNQEWLSAYYGLKETGNGARCNDLYVMLGWLARRSERKEQVCAHTHSALLHKHLKFVLLVNECAMYFDWCMISCGIVVQRYCVPKHTCTVVRVPSVSFEICTPNANAGKTDAK